MLALGLGRRPLRESVAKVTLLMMTNGIVVKHLSRPGTTGGLGMQSLSAGLELKAEVRTWTASKAAKSDSVEKGLGEDKTHRVKMSVGARDGQFWKGEHQRV